MRIKAAAATAILCSSSLPTPRIGSLVQVSLPLIANRQTCELLIADAERAAAAADWPLCSSIVARFADALRRRICGEESVLFPALFRMVAETRIPVQHMLREHARLGMLLDRVQSALGEENGEMFLACCEDLLAALRCHIAREERVLYPIAEQVFAMRGQTVTPDQVRLP